MKKILLIILCLVIFCDVSSEVLQPSECQPQSSGSVIAFYSYTDQQKNKANEEFNRLRELFAERYMQLHNDQETMQWFEKLKKQTLRKVQSYLDNEKFDLAAETALKLQDEITYNSELLARIRANAEYQEICKRIMSRTDLTQSEKYDWIKNHPYKFIPFKDDEGNTFGGKLDIDY